jgi:hypothetical protein
MNCAPFDLRDYYFEALGSLESGQVKEHLSRCESCSAELERLRLTALSLSALPDEEIPRRIAFVSDKVFEPSRAIRWWQAFWLSGARMAAASALVLAAAIAYHAVRLQPATQTVKVIEKTPIAASVDPAIIQAVVNQAVAKSTAEAEARYDLKLQRVMAENLKLSREVVRASEIFDARDRQEHANLVASNRPLEIGQ